MIVGTCALIRVFIAYPVCVWYMHTCTFTHIIGMSFCVYDNVMQNCLLGSFRATFSDVQKMNFILIIFGVFIELVTCSSPHHCECHSAIYVEIG